MVPVLLRVPGLLLRHLHITSQEAAGGPQAEQPEQSPATEEERSPPHTTPSTGRPLSPRQRRSQQRSHQAQRDGRDPGSRPAFPPAPRQPQEESHAGSAVLIVVLTLALAALIFRRIYLAHEYKFDYELFYLKAAELLYEYSCCPYLPLQFVPRAEDSGSLPLSPSPPPASDRMMVRSTERPVRGPQSSPVGSLREF
ncbi:ubiquitin-conjugating enzyme E2 J1 isoform X1 [Lates japonicus]|uniref:Ubiquitin-conjugating enzyme E2 J1 isoform X1 n=1 Tax=Lates japonicus TaxID=270547 RepID=A0AAD3RJS1_LATJO|nr:ubiquitin-conjugating enzyme E2 J1 isoform X1 [Lates japonicus]